jgi:hypothetical protein
VVAVCASLAHAQVLENIKLNDSLVPGGNVGGFQISSDSARVVYVADQDTNDVLELYSVPLGSSSAPVKLNGALVPGGLSPPGS